MQPGRLSRLARAIELEQLARQASERSEGGSGFVVVTARAENPGVRRGPLKLFDGLSSSVVGVQFVVTDDKSLTAVRLGGDDPFQAQIYESFLKKKFEQGLWVPDQCVLACERKADTTQDGSLKSPGGLLRSRLHIDRSGNFKFYMHAGCGNVTLMPYAIAQIGAVGCLRRVSGNPLRRIEQDEGS